MRIGDVISTTLFYTEPSHFDPSIFHCPIISEAKHLNGYISGIDTWADTACAGKHAFVEELFMGKCMTVIGFTMALGYLENLPIENILYTYD